MSENISLARERKLLFEAYREWMLEDPGGDTLINHIISLPGFSEWAEKNW
jgi:hypothetical protein